MALPRGHGRELEISVIEGVWNCAQKVLLELILNPNLSFQRKIMVKPENPLNFRYCISSRGVLESRQNASTAVCFNFCLEKFKKSDNTCFLQLLTKRLLDNMDIYTNTNIDTNTNTNTNTKQTQIQI